MQRDYLLPFLDEFPPALCRLLARKSRGREFMSTRDISHVSGLSPSTVDKLSTLTSWKTVGAETIHRFSLGCGINLISRSSRKRQREFWRRRRAKYLLNASRAQQRLIRRLMDNLRGRAFSGSPSRASAGVSAQARLAAAS